MKRVNELLQYRNQDYFKDKLDQQFLFETLNPIMRVAKLVLYKGSYYFNYTGYQVKADTTPCVALLELHQTKVVHLEYPQCTGVMLTTHALDCTSDVGVLWDGGKNNSKLPSTYFWTNVNLLRF